MKQNKFSPEPKAKLPTAPPQHQPNSRQRIFVVEADPALRLLNTEKLIDSGYQVDAAEDGSVAWDTLQLDSFDLLITDQHLPKLSGVELLHKIHTARISLPVIMATKIIPTWEFALHPWLLPATMLLKPYTFEKLLQTVKNLLCPTASAHAEIAPQPNWQSQSSANGLRL
jgi:two-component system alkaline phosphatase synthesis response regulator PhoP